LPFRILSELRKSLSLHNDKKLPLPTSIPWWTQTQPTVAKIGGDEGGMIHCLNEAGFRDPCGKFALPPAFCSAYRRTAKSGSSNNAQVPHGSSSVSGLWGVGEKKPFEKAGKKKK
jgi:hypothetical protein